MAIFRDTSKDQNVRGDRSARDRARHKQKIKDAIKGNIADIISEESIISQDRDKIIKVPIRGLREWRFVYGDNSPGVGQGGEDIQPGDVVSARRKNKGRPDSGGGDQPGVDYYETEITLGELIEMMFEDLSLPNLFRKEIRKVMIESKSKPKGYKRKGVPAQLVRIRTAKERIKRRLKTAAFLTSKEKELEKLIHLRDQEQDLDKKADLASQVNEKLIEINNLYRQKSLLNGSGLSDRNKQAGKNFPFINEDMRFRRKEEKPKEQSNAVVICIMDTSGSMDIMKKYLARSFFFLLYSFIRTKYSNVEVVFIAHETTA